MTRSIRHSVPDDAPAIIKLFDEVGLHPNARTQDLKWKYWTARSDWPGSRSYVLTTDEMVVAHAALVPGAILNGGHRYTVAHVIDWAARPGQGGAGVSLMKFIGQHVDALLAFGGSRDTLRILPHIGFHSIGTIVGFARPLSPLRALGGEVSLDWKLLPRLARNMAWKVTAPRMSSAPWNILQISDSSKLARIEACLPNGSSGTAVLERSVEQLRYSLRCTIVPMTLYSVEQMGHVGGYFVLAFAAGQVRVVDMWMQSSDPSDWRAMLNGAVAVASRHQNAAEIVLWASNSLQASAAVSCGFRARFQLPIQLRGAKDMSMGTEGLNVQLIDNDAAYLHEGVSTHWI